jgi:hypothetical protein
MKYWKTHLIIAAVGLAAASVLGSILAEPLMAQVRAALTKDVDNPARQPFNNRALAAWQSNLAVQATFLTVPTKQAGRR